MELPIIVNESRDINRSGDIMFFRSEAAASRYLEAIDVENNEYVAFDAVGRLLNLRTIGSHVIIEEAESFPNHDKLLRALLIEFFERAGSNQGPFDTLSLSELVEIGLATFEA